MQKTLHDNDRIRHVTSYPHAFPISLTHPEFPSDDSVLDQMAMPLGCVVNPFISMEDKSQAVAETHRMIDSGTRIARCGSCSAYINAFCETSPLRWFCSICGARNTFTRSMTRYRQIDLRLLPETQNLIVDYPMPFREIDGFKDNQRSVIPSHERPLVHIFLIQESMAVDAMQAVVDALTVAIKAMHPDIHIALLTFSNKIGIHRFSPSGHYPTVQYIHMATQEGSGKVFEGHDLAQVSEDPANMSVKVAMPMGAAADFFDVAFRVGSHREAAISAVSALFDSFPTADEGASFGRAPMPQVLLGPALEAISDWLLDPVDSIANSGSTSGGIEPQSGALGSDTGEKSLLNGSGGLNWGGLLGALQRMSASLLGDTGSEEQPAGVGAVAAVAGESGAAPGSLPSDSHGMSPIDICSGIVLHVFTSSPQDLPPRSHGSAPAAVPQRLAGISPTSKGNLHRSGGAGWPIGMDVQWVQALATRMGVRSLCVNLWAVCSFQGQEADLVALAPLAMQTGGQVHRCVLGMCPKDERTRFAELLRRSVTQQLATKCVLKLRTPSVVQLASPGGMIGPGFPDPELPGIYRLPACGPSSTVSYLMDYKHLEKQSQPNGQGNAVVMQVAFSYDTLVETNECTEDSQLIAGDLAAFLRENAENETAEDGSGGGKRPAQNLLKGGSHGSGSGVPGVRAVASDGGYVGDSAGRDGDGDDDGEFEGDVKEVKFTPSDGYDRAYFNTIVDVFDLSEDVATREVVRQRRRAERKQRQGSGSSSGGNSGASYATKKDRQRRAEELLQAPPEGALLIPDEAKGLSGSSASLFADHCVYNRQLRLVAVRRMRIISILIECTPKVPRLLQLSHPGTIAMIVARQAFLEDLANRAFDQPRYITLLAKPKKEPVSPKKRGGIFFSLSQLGGVGPSEGQGSDGSAPFGINTEGAARIFDTALPIVHAAVAYILRLRKSKEPPKSEEICMAVDEAMSHTRILRIMQVLFGTLNLLCNTHTQARTVDGGEEAVVLASQLLHIDAYTAQRLFYPELLPMDETLVVEQQFMDRPMPLRRESLLLASVGPERKCAAAFLLDAGVELIVYRTMVTKFDDKKAASWDDAEGEMALTAGDRPSPVTLLRPPLAPGVRASAIPMAPPAVGPPASIGPPPIGPPPIGPPPIGPPPTGLSPMGPPPNGLPPIGPPPVGSPPIGPPPIGPPPVGPLPIGPPPVSPEVTRYTTAIAPSTLPSPAGVLRPSAGLSSLSSDSMDSAGTAETSGTSGTGVVSGTHGGNAISKEEVAGGVKNLVESGPLFAIGSRPQALGVLSPSGPAGVAAMPASTGDSVGGRMGIGIAGGTGIGIGAGGIASLSRSSSVDDSTPNASPRLDEDRDREPEEEMETTPTKPPQRRRSRAGSKTDLLGKTTQQGRRSRSNSNADAAEGGQGGGLSRTPPRRGSRSNADVAEGMVAAGMSRSSSGASIDANGGSGSSSSSSSSNISAEEKARVKAEARYMWSNWLVNDLERRISVSQTMVPRAFIAEAGTSSAGYFTAHLLEDSSHCNGKSFADFLAFIRARIIESFEEDL